MDCTCSAAGTKLELEAETVRSVGLTIEIGQVVAGAAFGTLDDLLHFGTGSHKNNIKHSSSNGTLYMDSAKGSINF